MAHRIPTVSSAESNYLVPAGYVRRMERCVNAVCRVISSTGELGTGFLVGRQLIITNNHVLPTEESCTYVFESTVKGVAQFFYEDEKTAINVPLDAKSFFLTSPSPGKESAKGDRLDFTIVALATGPETEDLSRIYALPLSIFKDIVTPSKDDEAFMVQHPKGEKTQISWGPTRVIAQDTDNAHYNTKTFEGSSGSPVLNKERRLFALHRLGQCPVSTHGSCNQGVLIKSVVAYLNRLKNPQDPQKTWIATIQEWLDEKELPLLETAQRIWEKAKPFVDQAQKYFKKDRKEPFSRKKAYECLTQAYIFLTEALNQYKTSQEAGQKSDKQKIEQQRGIVRWQKMVLALHLEIPRLLPHSNDQNHPMLSLLSNPEEPILTLDKWLAWQQDQVKKDAKLESDPTICFLIACVAEEFSKNEVIENKKSEKTKLSAKWYVSLAQSYHDRHDNLFLKRACLKKALSLDSSIESEKIYDKLDKLFKSREEQFNIAFIKALKELDSQPGSTKPSCFIFYDREQETEAWIDRIFLPHLQAVGSGPLYDKKKKTKAEFINAICKGIRDSKYVLVLCTPSLVEKNDEADKAQELNKSADLPLDVQLVGYAFEMLHKFHIGARDSNILRLIQDGDSQESIPPTFVEREAFLFNTTLKYYENILRVFGIIKFDDGGAGGEPAYPVSVPLITPYGNDGDGGGGGNLVEQLISRLNMIHVGAEKMEAAAASGDPEANFHLAQCYAFGHTHGGVAKYDVNIDKAMDLYRKASSLEDGRAEVRLGQILIYQKGNPKEALEWFEKAEKKENLQALIELEKYYSKGKEVKDWARTELLRLRIETKLFEIKGRSLFADKTKEKLIFEHNLELANKEDLMGMMGLAWCYNNGCGVDKNPEEATRWQGTADRLQAKHAKAPSSVVEGKVLKSDPTTLPPVIIEELVAKPPAVESRVYRPDPTSLPENPSKSAASAKASVTAQPLAEGQVLRKDALSFEEDPSKPTPNVIKPLKEKQTESQVDIDLGSLAQNLQATNWAEQGFKKLQAQLQADRERGFRIEISHGHNVKPAAWAKQQFKGSQAELRSDREKYLLSGSPTSQGVRSFKPAAVVKQQLKGLKATLQDDKEGLNSETPQSPHGRAAKPAAAYSTPQNKEEKKSAKQEKQKNQNA